jgi:hypothetical protein
MRTATSIAHALIPATLRSRFSAAALSQPTGMRPGQVALFFALVLTLRLFLVHLYGVDLPYSDQWDSEGWNWLKPYQEGGIAWNILFLPHNEHRIVLVRLLSLALFALNNDQWDNLVSATFDVFFVAAVCALAARALLTHLAQDMWPLAMFLLAACCLPCGYENLLIGFQAQVYFLVALTVLGIWLAASRSLGVRTTIAIGLIAIVTLFTMASGLFTAFAIGLVLALRLWTTRSSWHAYVPLAVILLVAMIIGYRLLVHVENHQALQAQDLGDWLQALRIAGSWPLPASWLMVAIAWLPFTLGSIVLVRRREVDAAGIAATAIGAWTALQIASLAYGRARDLLHDQITVHSRYTDILALTVLVNVFFCLRLLRYPSARVQPKMRLVIASVWLTVMVAGYAAQGALGFVAMQQFSLSRQTQAENVRRYVQGANAAAIDTALPWNLPYPDKQRLKMMLDDKTVRDILPASTRQALPIGAYFGGFSVNGMPAGVPRSQGKGAYGSYAPKTGNDNIADMTAAGLHSRFPYLQFAIAGYLGLDGLDLNLESGDGTTSHRVAPAIAAKESWAIAAVRVPSSDFRLHARDNSRTAWFAFAEPTEIGRLSLWTEWLLAISPALLFATLLAVYFLVQLFWLRQLQTADSEAVARRE